VSADRRKWVAGLLEMRLMLMVTKWTQVLGKMVLVTLLKQVLKLLGVAQLFPVT
jgi:hypothetical protein